MQGSTAVKSVMVLSLKTSVSDKLEMTKKNYRACNAMHECSINGICCRMLSIEPCVQVHARRKVLGLIA